MSVLAVLLITIVVFVWAYAYYAKRLESLWSLDPKRATPAYSKFDSVDYIPAKNWLVLFGHHFSSIAGAGPIIGPVIAVSLWGWGPALCWIILGSVFIGGVHDFGSLITSVREGGTSIADIAEHTISKKAKLLFALFVWLTLILVIAVFAYLCADTFVKEPKIVIPSLGLIPVAVLVGYLLYNIRARASIVTILGLVSLVYLIFMGMALPVKGSLMTWLLVLLGYCYVASVLPVNILLQPRDYLSSFLLFFGVAVGYSGLFISRPTINAPAFSALKSSEGYLWPALFVTVACGAVSGFHSLIASGTTSKQIASERHVKRISYGGMLTEGLVAVLAVACAIILYSKTKSLSLTLKELGPIGIFSKGFGVATRSLLGDNGPFIAVTILNAFILTTLDTATRISRYLTEELFMIKNRYVSTTIIIIASAALAISGKWNRIWPAFGASNQLVAALALFVLSCWLLSKNKTIKYTFPPALFMLITTIGALFLQGIAYFKQRDFVLFCIDVILLLLSGLMIYEITLAVKKQWNKKELA